MKLPVGPFIVAVLAAVVAAWLILLGARVARGTAGWRAERAAAARRREADAAERLGRIAHDARRAASAASIDDLHAHGKARVVRVLGAEPQIARLSDGTELAFFKRLDQLAAAARRDPSGHMHGRILHGRAPSVGSDVVSPR